MWFLIVFYGKKNFLYFFHISSHRMIFVINDYQISSLFLDCSVVFESLIQFFLSLKFLFFSFIFFFLFHVFLKLIWNIVLLIQFIWLWFVYLIYHLKLKSIHFLIWYEFIFTLFFCLFFFSFFFPVFQWVLIALLCE